MNVTNIREYQTRRLESAAGRMVEALAAMRVPDELQAVWNSRLSTAAKRRVLEAETKCPGDGLPAMWRELLAVETAARRAGS